MQRILGSTSLNGGQWLTCIVVAIVLLLVDEVIKFFLRRSHRKERPASSEAPAPLTPRGAPGGRNNTQ
jgi:P-type Ca2+ transporter type 2C